MNNKFNFITGCIGVIIIILLCQVVKNTSKDKESHYTTGLHLVYAEMQDALHKENEKMINSDNGFIISSRYACVVDTTYGEKRIIWYEKGGKYDGAGWNSRGEIAVYKILSLLKSFAPLAKQCDAKNVGKEYAREKINTKGLKNPYFDEAIFAPTYEKAGEKGYVCFYNFIFYIDEIDNAIIMMEKAVNKNCQRV